MVLGGDEGDGRSIPTVTSAASDDDSPSRWDTSEGPDPVKCPNATAAEPFASFYERSWSTTVGLARLLIEDRALAEDIAQEAFARTLLRWSRVDDPALYLRRCIVNGCRSELRKRAVRRRELPATRDRDRYFADLPRASTRPSSLRCVR